MARKGSEDKQPDGRIGNQPQQDGLKHNPFAALRKGPELPRDAREIEARPVSVPTPAQPKKAARVAPPAPPGPSHGQDRVVVRLERKGHGGKTVTIAEGAGLAGHDIETLARDAARALGVGARSESGALVVQGEQTDRLIAWLVARKFRSVVRGN